MEIKESKELIKGKTKLDKFLDIYYKYKDLLFYIAIAILIIHLIFYIFVSSKAFMNSDSAFFVDYAALANEEGSLFPSKWVNTNDFWVYSLIPIISVALKAGAGYFASRQIAVFVQSIIFILLIFELYIKLMKDKSGFKIVLLLILSGISGQFIFEMFGDASYGSIVFYMLLEIILLIKYLTNPENKRYIIIFGILLFLLSSFSLRFPIYLGAPLICALLYLIYKESFIKKYLMSVVVIILTCALGFLGHVVLINSLQFETNYEDNTLVEDYEDYNENITQTAYNYFFICGCTNLNTKGLKIEYNNDIITPSSPLIAIIFVRACFAIFTLVLPFILLKKVKLMNLPEKLLFIFTVSHVILLVFFLIFGNMAWWHRYYIPALFFLVLLYPLGYKYIFRSEQRNRVIFKFVMVGLVLSSMFLIFTSEYDLEEHKIRENPYQKIADYLLSKGYSYGYCGNGEEGPLYSLLTDGKLIVIRINGDGYTKSNWLTNSDWLERDFFNGRTFFIRNSEYPAIPIENKAISTYYIDDLRIQVYRNNDAFCDRLEELEATALEKEKRNEDKQQKRIEDTLNDTVKEKENKVVDSDDNNLNDNN